MSRKDDPRAKDDAVFALLGRAAANLSYMEFAVTELLQILLDPNEPIASAIIVEEMTFSKRIHNIRRLSALRFALDDDMRSRLLDLASRVDSYRSKRNLFVHGHWRLDVGPMGMRITCVDHRWDIDTKNTRSWSRLREQSWTEDELTNFNREVQDLTEELVSVTSQVRRNTQCNRGQPKDGMLPGR